MSLAFEFLVLLAAMLMAANGWAGAAVVYGLYSAFNLLAGWMLLADRI